MRGEHHNGGKEGRGEEGGTSQRVDLTRRHGEGRDGGGDPLPPHLEVPPLFTLHTHNAGQARADGPRPLRHIRPLGQAQALDIVVAGCGESGARLRNEREGRRQWLVGVWGAARLGTKEGGGQTTVGVVCGGKCLCVWGGGECKNTTGMGRRIPPSHTCHTKKAMCTARPSSFWHPDDMSPNLAICGLLKKTDWYVQAVHVSGTTQGQASMRKAATGASVRPS